MSGDPPEGVASFLEETNLPQRMHEIPLYILRKWEQEAQNLIHLWNKSPSELQSKSEDMIDDFVNQYGSNLEYLLDKPISRAVGVGGINWIRLMSGSLQFSFPMDILRFEVLFGDQFFKKFVSLLQKTNNSIDISSFIEKFCLYTQKVRIPITKSDLLVMRGLTLPIVGDNYDGFPTYSEMAKRIGISRQTIKNRMDRMCFFISPTLHFNYGSLGLKVFIQPKYKPSEDERAYTRMYIPFPSHPFGMYVVPDRIIPNWDSIYEKYFVEEEWRSYNFDNMLPGTIWKEFPEEAFLEYQVHPRGIQINHSSPPSQLSPLDYKILEQAQSPLALHNTHEARRLNISKQHRWNRLSELKQQGVFKRYYRFSGLGLTVRYMSLIWGNVSAALKEKMFKISTFFPFSCGFEGRNVLLVFFEIPSEWTIQLHHSMEELLYDNENSVYGLTPYFSSFPYFSIETTCDSPFP